MKDRFDYDPVTGVFRYRRKISNKSAGTVAGTIAHNGYCDISIDGQKYGAHRLAWFWMTGEWPLHEVDHRNRKQADNRWRNLRPATRLQNMANSKVKKSNRTGLKGVQYYRRGNKFCALIRKHGKRVYLGSFETAAEAHAVYMAAATDFHGSYAPQ